MKPRIGLWIDHRRAAIVTISDAGEAFEQILSSVERQLRRSGDSPLEGAYESRQAPADDRQERAFTGQLNTYYDAVMARVRLAESILLFGPAEAKDELRQRLERDHLGECIIAMETVDRMTNRQIVAKVRTHFQEWRREGRHQGPALWSDGKAGAQPAARP